MRNVASRTRAPALGAALVALSLGAAACGGTEADEQAVDSGSSASESSESPESESSEPDSSEPESEAVPTGPVLDPSVFSGQATTIDGASFDLGPLANKDLVVWFWAPW